MTHESHRENNHGVSQQGVFLFSDTAEHIYVLNMLTVYYKAAQCLPQRQYFVTVLLANVSQQKRATTALQPPAELLFHQPRHWKQCTDGKEPRPNIQWLSTPRLPHTHKDSSQTSVYQRVSQDHLCADHGGRQNKLWRKVLEMTGRILLTGVSSVCPVNSVSSLSFQMFVSFVMGLV